MAWIETGQFFKDKAMDVKTAPDVEKQQKKKLELAWNVAINILSVMLERTKEIGLGYVLQMVGFTNLYRILFQSTDPNLCRFRGLDQFILHITNRLIAYTSQPSSNGP